MVVICEIPLYVAYILLISILLRDHNWVHFTHRPYCTVALNFVFFHVCEKEFLDSNLHQTVISTISNFHEIAPNLPYSQKVSFLKFD